MLVVIFGPVAAMWLVTYPKFGAVIIVGVGLLYSVKVVRRIARHQPTRDADSLWPSSVRSSEPSVSHGD